jgi:hypothetical protein
MSIQVFWSSPPSAVEFDEMVEICGPGEILDRRKVALAGMLGFAATLLDTSQPWGSDTPRRTEVYRYENSGASLAIIASTPDSERSAMAQVVDGLTSYLWLPDVPAA